MNIFFFYSRTRFGKEKCVRFNINDNNDTRRKKAKIQNRTQTAPASVGTFRSMWKGNDSEQKASSIECSWYSWRIFFFYLISFFLFHFNHISQKIEVVYVIRSIHGFTTDHRMLFHHLFIVLRGEWNHRQNENTVNMNGRKLENGMLKWLANRTQAALTNKGFQHFKANWLMCVWFCSWARAVLDNFFFFFFFFLLVFLLIRADAYSSIY